MSEHGVNLSRGGVPQTVLPPADPAIRRALSTALEMHAAGSDDLLSALGDVAGTYPTALDAWAELGDHGRTTIERYAYYRVGYHRGLDALRHNGWRGSGYVKWEAPDNRGFLRCLDGLREMAVVIGETSEAERCRLFLLQLDPSWERREV